MGSGTLRTSHRSTTEDTSRVRRHLDNDLCSSHAAARTFGGFIFPALSIIEWKQLSYSYFGKECVCDNE